MVAFHRDFYEKGGMYMNINDILTLLLVIFTALTYLDNHQLKK